MCTLKEYFGHNFIIIALSLREGLVPPARTETPLAAALQPCDT